MFGQLAKGMKDGALAMALKSYLNDRFSEYGEIVECQVDTAANRLSVQVQLRGERERVSACIERYDLTRQGEKRFITLHRFSSSREWLTRLLTALFGGKRYELPAAVAALL